MAGSVTRSIEHFELPDIGDDQRGVVVGDVEDLERQILAVPESRSVVAANHLEPNLPTVSRCMVRDDPELEGDVDVSA